MNFFIKTKCGLEKYDLLKSRAGAFAKVRFFWFIVFASIRDLFEKEDPKDSQVNNE